MGCWGHHEVGSGRQKKEAKLEGYKGREKAWQDSMSWASGTPAGHLEGMGAHVTGADWAEWGRG